MFKNFLEIPFKPVKSDKIYWKFMGRLITVSNNDSGSNAKAKISFDIKNVKKQLILRENLQQSNPFFRLKVVKLIKQERLKKIQEHLLIKTRLANNRYLTSILILNKKMGMIQYQ